MCLLWITTYTLVLIGTIKYKYPLISPITQAIIAPFEFSVLLLFLKMGPFRLDYATIAYLYWSIIEILIIVVMIKNQYIRKGLIVPYIGALLAMTTIMIYCVTIKERMFFFSYLNTFVGVIVWLIYIINDKDFPLNRISLAIFFTKLTADTLAVPVYFEHGYGIEKILCVLLPVLDSFFVLLFIYRKRNLRTKAC